MTTITKQAILNGKLSPAERQLISTIIDRLGRAEMTETAHGYRVNTSETVLEAVGRGKQEYIDSSRNNPAVAIMSVVLAANRNYNRQVKHHVDAMRSNQPGLTIKQLRTLIAKAQNAENFRTFWGHKDEKKFQILKDLISLISSWLGDLDTQENDFCVMSRWAKKADFADWKNDPVGSIPYVGPATFQHLRMVFGADTVKPDQRVKEVLEREFQLGRLSERNAVLAVERIAESLNASPRFIDQIFVKYGSGHYASRGARGE